MSVRVIVISGSMGSGKTTVLGEASDILSARGVIHAAIDLDAIGSALLPDALSSDVMYRNLASVWVNFCCRRREQALVGGGGRESRRARSTSPRDTGRRIRCLSADGRSGNHAAAD